MRTILVATALAVILLAPATASRAQEASEPYVSKAEYEKLKREVEALQEQMKALAAGGSKKADSAAVKEDDKADKPAPKAAESDASPPPRATLALPAADREQEAVEARRQLELFMREQRLLFRQGELQLELAASYSQDSSERFIFPPVGNDLNFAFSSARFRAAEATFIARYGVTDDLELDLDIPFLYAEQELDFFGGGSADASDGGLDDVGAGLRYALFREEGARPDVILSLSTRAPTGNVDVIVPVDIVGTENRADVGLDIDSWNVGGAVTLVKTVDPVVFFVQAGYTKTFSDDGIDPGDQFPYAFGLGFSLNDRISVRTAMSGIYVDNLQIDGQSIEGSDLEINSLTFAVTGQLSRNVFIEPFVGFGLTEDATDYTVGLSLLYTVDRRFPLFGK